MNRAGEPSSFPLGPALLFAFVVIVGAMAGGAWWWWERNSAQLAESAKAAYLDGKAAGRKLSENGCLDRAITRHVIPENQSFVESIRTGISLRGCLDSAKPDAAFCEGTPVANEVIANMTWTTQACDARKLKDSYCPQLMGQVAEYCQSPERGAKVFAVRGA